jgi:hypothetical protein
LYVNIPKLSFYYRHFIQPSIAERVFEKSEKEMEEKPFIYYCQLQKAYFFSLSFIFQPEK